MEGPRIVNRGHTTNMPTGVSETKGTMYGPATMDLRDRLEFPSWDEMMDGLPIAPDANWCFLVEIIASGEWRGKPAATVQDRNGEILKVVLALRGGDTFDPRLMVRGKTLGVMRVWPKGFGDEGNGVIVERSSQLTILDAPLQDILAISDALKRESSKNCRFCDKIGPLKCRCKNRYCGRECHKQHWRQGHRYECNIIRQIRRWSKEDW